MQVAYATRDHLTNVFQAQGKAKVEDYCIYCLCKERSAQEAERVLRALLKEPSPASREYELAYSESGSAIFADPFAAMHMLEDKTALDCNFYWNEGSDHDATNGLNINQAFMVFTSDGALIAGIAVATSSPLDSLRHLCRVCGTQYGAVTGDEAPPNTVSELLALREDCKEWIARRE